MTTTSEPLRIPTDVVIGGHLAMNTATLPASSVTDSAVTSNAKVAYTKLQHRFPVRWTSNGARVVLTARSPVQNIDNGSATTVDHTILRHPKAIEIVAARIVYDTETTGTVASATAQLGTTVGGTEVVAATNYENTKAVGTTTAMTLADGTVAAGTPVIFRHTGIAATAAGEAHIEIDYYVDDTTVYDCDQIVHTVYGVSGGIDTVEVVCGAAPTSSSSFTVDVKKGSESSAFASVLSSVITVDSTVSDREVKAGTVTGGTLANGDSIQIVIATSGAFSTQGTDVCVTVNVWENPQTT